MDDRNAFLGKLAMLTALMAACSSSLNNDNPGGGSAHATGGAKPSTGISTGGSTAKGTGGRKGTGGTVGAGGVGGSGEAAGGDGTPTGTAGSSESGGADNNGGAGGSGGDTSGGAAGNGGAGNTGSPGGNGGIAAAGGAAGGADPGPNCTMCHGDAASNNPAPPRDIDDNTDTASPGVGAHAKHLSASGWHRQGKCVDCHQVPTSVPHSNGKVDFSWNAPSNASGAAPSFDTTALTCSGVYCHGTKLAGASSAKTTPVWNQVNETWNACGTACHATPPPASTGHPASTACETCHGKVIASFKAGNPPVVVWKDASLHVNGTVDVDQLTCTSCHGSAASPAPPTDTKGNSATTAAGVGAHAQHLATSTWHRQGKCADCHVTPTSTAHSDGKVDFSWGAPSNASGATPAFNTTDLSCSGTYCHGSKLPGTGSAKTTPVWNQVNNTWDACGTACHTTPPGGSHTTSTACQNCHGAVITSFAGANSVWKDASQHINGKVDVSMNCSSCHGSTAPTLPPGDECHRMVNGRGDACAACHGSGTSKTVAPTSGHMDGKATYSSGSANGVTFNAGTMTCTSNCHGAERWGNCSGD